MRNPLSLAVLKTSMPQASMEGLASFPCLQGQVRSDPLQSWHPPGFILPSGELGWDYPFLPKVLSIVKEHSRWSRGGGKPLASPRPEEDGWSVLFHEILSALLEVLEIGPDDVKIGIRRKKPTPLVWPCQSTKKSGYLTRQCMSDHILKFM